MDLKGILIILAAGIQLGVSLECYACEHPCKDELRQAEECKKNPGDKTIPCKDGSFCYEIESANHRILGCANDQMINAACALLQAVDSDVGCLKCNTEKCNSRYKEKETESVYVTLRLDPVTIICMFGFLIILVCCRIF